MELNCTQAWTYVRDDIALIMCPRIASESIKHALGWHDREKAKEGWHQDKFVAEKVAYFVRDPLDRLISQYHLHMRKRGPKLGHDCTFDQFVDRIFKLWSAGKAVDRHWWSQTEYYSGPNGLIMPSFLGRYEDLTNEWDKFREWSGWDVPDLEHKHQSKRCSGYYDSDKTLTMAKARFADDSYYFGY